MRSTDPVSDAEPTLFNTTFQPNRLSLTLAPFLSVDCVTEGGKLAVTSEPGCPRLKTNKKMVETLAKVRLARWLGLALRQSRPGKNSAKSRGIRNNTTRTGQQFSWSRIPNATDEKELKKTTTTANI